MVKREELTEMFKTEAFDDPRFKKGLVLKFARATIKLTKVDRKNMRVWGEQINLYDFNTGMSHYGHDVDTTDPKNIICRDCKVTIDQESTEDGEVKAAKRQEVEEAVEDDERKVKEKDRRFRYELLCQDGTIKHFAAGRRKRVTEIAKIVDARQIAVVPMIYYPMRFAEAALYSDKEVDFDANTRNPHLNTLQGDPDLGEPEEFFIVGNVLAEFEVKL